MSQKKTKQNKQTGTLECSSFNLGDLQFTTHSTPREGIRSTILHLRTEHKCRPTHIPWVQQEIRKGWRETLRTHHAGGSTPVVCISALSSFQIGTVILVAGEAQFNQRAPDPHLARDGAKSSDTDLEHKTSALAVISAQHHCSSGSPQLMPSSAASVGLSMAAETDLEASPVFWKNSASIY